MAPNRVVLPMLALAVLAAACQDAREPLAPADEPAAALAPLPQQPSTDPIVLARSIPGFGGLFLDDEGRPTVYLKDVAQEGRARRVLGAFARVHGYAPSDVRVLEADYDYLELDRWFKRSTPGVLVLPGTVFTDLDEAHNRLLIGVEEAGLEPVIEQVMARLRIPSDAFEISVVPPIQFAATLRDRWRPTIGGIQIHFSRFLCTLGFNAFDGTERSFITNSHCTEKQGGVEGTDYFQPTSSVDPTVIADEVEDPVYFTGGVCPRGKKCRYSDSSRALYRSGTDSKLGAIAQTSGPNNGDLNVTGEFSIGGKGDVVVGTVVNKVGRTTGWTQGKVTNTCVNTSVLGTNIMQLCQHFVSAGVAGGDSGSPVFTGTATVTLVGILWGGTSDNSTFVFSPINQVEQELGTLTVN
ncbi:MAG: hypothetical protein HY703_08920 [Gemmatimonadetes bacterium]|nr:hypothetical protein [Gemmatimonadota bacterium]